MKTKSESMWMQLACLATDGATISHVLLRDSLSLTNFMQKHTVVVVCYDEMYIDLQHILLVITEFGFAKTCC